MRAVQEPHCSGVLALRWAKNVVDPESFLGIVGTFLSRRLPEWQAVGLNIGIKRDRLELQREILQH